MQGLPPSPPPHPEVGQSYPECDAREAPAAELTSTPPQGEAKGCQFSTAPANGGQGSSSMPPPEEDEDKLLRKRGQQPGWVPEGEEYQRPSPFGFAGDHPIRMCPVDPLHLMKVIISVDDTKEAMEYAKSVPIIDYLLGYLPKMIKYLQGFHEDTTLILRSNIRVSFDYPSVFFAFCLHFSLLWGHGKCTHRV